MYLILYLVWIVWFLVAGLLCSVGAITILSILDYAIQRLWVHLSCQVCKQYVAVADFGTEAGAIEDDRNAVMRNGVFARRRHGVKKTIGRHRTFPQRGNRQ